MKNIIIFLLFAGICTALMGINVTGNQSGSWTPDNNPYNVTGTITVPSGDTLVIYPGVNVVINGNYQINVIGQLFAIGTENDSIRFSNTVAAMWQGIRLENSQQASLFTHCLINKADTGINSVSGKFIISKSEVSNGNRGFNLMALSETNPPPMVIKTSKIHGFVRNGIYIVEAGNTLIDSCEVYNCGTGTQFYAAIQLSNQGTTTTNNPTIRNNNIHHNLKQGISAWDLTGTSAINPIVENNIINYNLTGVYLLHASGTFTNNDISYNFITGNPNSGAGVMLSGADSNPTFMQNTITHNFTGFYIVQGATANLGDLTNDYPGDDGMNTIAQNIDESLVTHSVYNLSVANLKAENNIWDSTDPAVIDQTIQDGLDEAAYGIVDYLPIYSPPQQVSTIQGVLSSDGNYDTYQICIMEPYTYQICDTLILTNTGAFTYTTTHTGNYYLIAQAFSSANPGNIAGAAMHGGFLNPIELTLVTGDTLSNINLNIAADYPKQIAWLGESFVTQNKTIYPMTFYKTFGVPHKKALLYQEGQYLKVFGFAYKVDGEWDTLLVENGGNWLKTHELALGQSWTVTDLENGQLITYQANVVEIDTLALPSGAQEAYRIDFTNPDNSKKGKLWLAHDLGIVQTRTYANYCLTEKTILCESLINGGEGYFPLANSNIWTYHELELENYPNNLTALIYDNPTYAVLSWDPPAAYTLPYVGYNIYRNGVIIATTTMAENSYTVTDLSQVYTYWISASNNTYESPYSPSIIIDIIGNSDQVAAPVFSASVYPNPFGFKSDAKSGLSFAITLPAKDNVKIEIFNIKGQKVKSIFTPNLNKGLNKIIWNGLDDSGRKISSGVYLYKVSSHKNEKCQKFLILK